MYLKSSTYIWTKTVRHTTLIVNYILLCTCTSVCKCMFKKSNIKLCISLEPEIHNWYRYFYMYKYTALPQMVPPFSQVKMMHVLVDSIVRKTHMKMCHVLVCTPSIGNHIKRLLPYPSHYEVINYTTILCS